MLSWGITLPMIALITTLWGKARVNSSQIIPVGSPLCRRGHRCGGALFLTPAMIARFLPYVSASLIRNLRSKQVFRGVRAPRGGLEAL